MNPFLKSFIASLCMLFFLITSKAQKLYYSEPLNNLNSWNYRIVGRVNDNIIIETYLLSNIFSTSKFWVFDNEMHSLNNITYDNFSNGFLTTVVNEKNSFSIINQSIDSGFYTCKLVCFNDSARITKQEIVEKKIFEKGENYDYEVIHSKQEKSIALLKILPNAEKGVIIMHYIFLQNDSISQSGNIILPFDVNSSALCPAYLNGNELLLPIANNSDSSSSLTIYKIDLDNNKSINTVRSFSFFNIVAPSISINFNGDFYSVIAVCKAQNMYSDNIMSWHLNKDLTDRKTDTIFTASDGINTCLKNSISQTLKIFYLKNKSADIILSSGNLGKNNGSSGNVYRSSQSYISNPTSPSGGFYEGRVMSMYNQTTLNGNGTDNFSNIVHGQTWGNSQLKSSPYYKNNTLKKNFNLVNINDKNYSEWLQCLDEKALAKILPEVENYFYLNDGEHLQFIYSNTTKKNQFLNYITLNNKENLITNNILSMNFNYKYYVENSEQIDQSSCVIPVNFKGKQAFCKLIF